ncbi:MAG: pacearchaeosortase [Nanoarchaeota archaeon]|nr:pacearchaeosortase [Nanoarchaeota archaeon]
MKENSKYALRLFIRYLSLVLITALGMEIIYSIFLPLTKYPPYFILNIFYNAILAGDMILIGNYHIEIIGACVAGSAYYFLLVLNLSTAGIKPLLRIKMLLAAFGIFLFINVSRIVVLSIMYVNDSPIFDITHKILWYAGSTIIVVGIWFFEVSFFRVKGIPFYTDLKKLYNLSSLKRK